MSDSTATDPETFSSTAFIAVPTPVASPDARDATRLAVDTVRRACTHLGPCPAGSWHVAVSEGRMAPTEVSAALRRSIRRKLISEVDAFLGLLCDASYGCGREASWAIEFGIPTLLMHPRAVALSPLAGGTPPETPVDVREYGSLAELHDIVRDWMHLRRVAILAGPMRRDRQLANTEPLRIATRTEWKKAAPEERRRVSDAVQVDLGQLDAVLANSLDFAAMRGGVMLDVASQLGITVPERMMPRRDWHRRSEVPVLPHDARKGLQDAIDTWDWDGSTTLRAVELGLGKLRHDGEVLMAGGLQRAPSLGNRFAWKRLLDKDAR